MRSKQLVGLLDKLTDLLDEHTDIFFEERKFLEELVDDPKIECLNERRLENETKIKKTIEVLNEDLGAELLEEPRETMQEILL